MKKDQLKIGLRVISKCKISDWFNQVGTIIFIEEGQYRIKFDRSFSGSDEWNVSFGSPVDQVLEKYIPDDMS